MFAKTINQFPKQKGFTLVGLLLAIFVLTTVAGLGKFIKEEKVRKEKVGTPGSFSQILPPQERETSQKITITQGLPATSNVSSQKASSQKDQPVTSRKDEKETSNIQPPFPKKSVSSRTGIKSSNGPKHTFDYEDYLYFQEQAQSGQIFEGHPDYQYYQELQQQFGQPAIFLDEPQTPAVYLNPLNDPNINPMANSDINPLMNPNINPLANPAINPLADPSLNPGCIPCQAGFGGGWESFSGGEGNWGGWGGGFGGWGR